MARYTGPVCRICRREGMKLFLKGEKCFTKCTFEKRSSGETSRTSNDIMEVAARAKTQTRPGWLDVDPDAYTANVLAAPSRDQIEAQINTQLIVEHYAR